MKLKIKSHLTGTPNMIPTIDILFQLVIFFVLACQFAVTEQFPIAVPDKCAAAKPQPEDQRNITAVTIMNAASGDGVECAVGGEKLAQVDEEILADKITEALDKKMDAAGHHVVCLRIAKDVPFRQSFCAIKGIWNCDKATDIQMAVLKN
jgi:biopolymer transport protein ExbD